MWFIKILQDENNLNEALNYYENELKESRKEINQTGLLEKISLQLPGIIEYRFNQLQEIEAILEHFSIKRKKIYSEKYKKYLENSQKILKNREITLLLDGDDDIIYYDNIINIVSNIRNKFLGIIKGLEVKTFQINNITKLRCAGLEDTDIKFSYIPVKIDKNTEIEEE